MKNITKKSSIPYYFLYRLVFNALNEDLGNIGDLTTYAVIIDETTCIASINARETGIIYGIELARISFQIINPNLKIKVLINDGAVIKSGNTCMIIEGDAKSILITERIALNLLSRLSGIATMTSIFVKKTKGTNTKITSTRKTTPGLRIIEKEAIIFGGGFNHRFGLYDAVLIKDNHIALAGSIKNALERANQYSSHVTSIKIEVDTNTSNIISTDFVCVDYLKINYLGCLFVHLLTFSGVQFSGVYFAHLFVETVFCCRQP